MIHLNQLWKLQNPLKSTIKILRLIKEQLAQKSTNINGNLLTKLVEKIKVVIVCVHQSKNKPKKSNEQRNSVQPKATAREDDTSEQTKKVIIVDDSIFNHVRGYYLSHSLENCQVRLKNLPSARVKCMQDYVKPSLRKHPHHLNNSF